MAIKSYYHFNKKGEKKKMISSKRIQIKSNFELLSNNKYYQEKMLLEKYYKFIIKN